jgi:hypothetical protein
VNDIVIIDSCGDFKENGKFTLKNKITKRVITQKPMISETVKYIDIDGFVKLGIRWVMSK